MVKNNSEKINKTKEVAGSVKKIIRIITFVTLIVCYMSNANVAFAGCPRTSLNKYYDHYSENCEWDYYNHELIQAWVGRDAVAKNKMIAIAAFGGAVAAATTGAVGWAIGTAAATFTISWFDGMATEWLRSSEDHDFCGVKIHYCKNWLGQMEYKGFEPQ